MYIIFCIVQSCMKLFRETKNMKKYLLHGDSELKGNISGNDSICKNKMNVNKHSEKKNATLASYG